MQEKDKIVFKGSHPDSLYRVAACTGSRDGKLSRIFRLLRWPAALLIVCLALAVFVYFLMPDSNDTSLTKSNSTAWESGVTGQSIYEIEKDTDGSRIPSTTGTKTSEIDFYASDSGGEKDSEQEINNNLGTNGARKLPVPPVFPSHLNPEVQYGNEKADSDNNRSPKLLSDSEQLEDSTLKPHITQKAEKPLAIYFKDSQTSTTMTTTSTSSTTEAVTTAEKAKLYTEKTTTLEENVPNGKWNSNIGNTYLKELKLSTQIEPKDNTKTDIKFTSGHSKLFGISIEDAERFSSTTQSSLYNTRVSPTLPVWRDVDDVTTNKYPVSSDGQPQCRSTQIPLCLGVLPYDLTGASFEKDLKTLLPQFEYLVRTNCSDRVKQFACALLEPECSPHPYAPRQPCQNLCRVVMESCEESVSQELSSYMKCDQYPQSNCLGAKMPCSTHEITCSDGSCISRDWACDGHNDCSTGEDEIACTSCGKDHYRCRFGGGCIVKRWLCDGYADCPQGDDEDEFSCNRLGTKRVDLNGDIEESAASAPAPSIRRPNRVPSQLKSGENDNSKELLMTSDTSNPYRRNYTRGRPSMSRLTPYSRLPQNPKTESYNQTYEGNDVKKVNYVSSENVSPYPDVIKNNPGSSKRRETRKTTTRRPITRLSETTFKVNTTELKEKSTYQTSETSPIMKSKLKATSMTAHSSPCPNDELRCVDGRCITPEQLCDGVVDCTDNTDEDNCST